MDIRRRMLFKKKASSSGGGGSTAGGSYTVNLNSQWEKTTAVTNPDSTLYDGVYRSSSNYNVDSGVAIMYITISGYKKFSLYIRSYAESNYDYVMVGQLDKAITGSTSYSSTDVKAHTRGNQQSGTAISNYTLVEFDNMTGETHVITIVYRKDGSVNNNDDRGYVLISKNNEGYGTIEPEEPESGGSSTINVGDIAYWDGSKVKTVSSDNWSTLLGTAIGVVVIPEGFAPDGKARIVGLKPMDSFGMTNSYKISLYWDASGNCVDTSLTNYTKVPTTDNVSSNSTGSASISNSTTGNGCLPSDKFTGIQSYVDAISKYSVTSYLIPSPYSGDTYNPEYYKTISGNNALSDFNGLSNTQALVSLGSNYQAANYCWDYNDGSGSNIQWYLPAMGELGYLMPRLNAIDEIIVSLGGVAIQDAASLWSSSEYDSENVNYLELGSGRIRRRSKVTTTFARSFATIENNNGINTDDYLTIEALEDGLTASLSVNACEYCVDGDGNWKSLTAGTATQSINTGHTLSFRGNLIPNISDSIGTFTINKKCNLKGNCMSMLFKDNAVNNYSLSGKDCAFCNLFKNCTNIVTVSENFLPATTLSRSCYNSMFYGCTNLTIAPELPATILADDCYYRMFTGCTGLITTPELPATTLAGNCYNGMFTGCTGLKAAPELPATTLASYCYSNMFNGCTSLTTAPVLPATTLADSCYYSMFISCTNLAIAHELPATTLADYCYDSMFRNCTSLITAPELPATTLADYCYDYMFSGCTSLTTAPELPATTLANWCYQSMFYKCAKLKYIKMLATDISASNCLYYWTYGVASTGTFVKNPAMNSLPTGSNGIPRGWTVVNDGEESGNIDNYLTIEALEDGLTASLSVNACEYCVDGDGNWKTLSAGTATEAINSGQTLSFRGELTPTSSNDIGIGTFTISKKCNLKGNCMSMLFGDNAANNYSLNGKDYAFNKLFNNCSNIVNVSSGFLPATTLAPRCYNGMFSYCTSLTTAPELPATTLASYCYRTMFYGCSSLTAATELPATTLAYGCYSEMFYGCTSLTTAPELPATTLATNCYEYMFYGCSKLNYIKMLATNTASGCLSGWVSGVASSGTFVKHPNMASLPTGISGIPSGWTVQNA